MKIKLLFAYFALSSFHIASLADDDWHVINRENKCVRANERFDEWKFGHKPTNVRGYAEAKTFRFYRYHNAKGNRHILIETGVGDLKFAIGMAACEAMRKKEFSPEWLPTSDRR